MQINQAYNSLKDSLEPLYGTGESTQMAHWVIEHLTGWSRADRLIHGSEDLAPEQARRFETYRQELLQWRPVQYVLGEAWFAGMRFYVDERVLIPRPETEELVEWIVKEVGFGKSDLGSEKKGSNPNTSNFPNPTSKILDIGTGSGCIPIALKKKLPGADVWSVDKSADALALATKNAAMLDADIRLLELDILDSETPSRLPQFDIIVSNPPYVPVSDKEAMRPNVKDYEPPLALFVENNDPLLFYRAIGAYGLRALTSGGRLYFEIHASAGAAVQALIASMGYRDIECRKDLGGQDRMVAATRP